MTTGSLSDQVADLLQVAQIAYDGTGHAGEVQRLRDRAAEPLRVAIAGKVKAGKSTLLNALVGTNLAPTDATECTRVVTWYRDGRTYDVRIHPHKGKPRQATFENTDVGVAIDLGGLSADEIERLDVTWPSPSLRDVTLIDTPGVGSASKDVAARTWRFLAPEDEGNTEADCVLYLMRHLHVEDVDLLRAFHDDEIAQATPINAVAVLSRADEIGAGRLDAMESAARVAARLGAEPAIRRLVQTVVPVAGLLAQAGATLTEPEFRSLRALADQPPADLERQLLSVDRFARDVEGSAVGAAQRRELVQRLGVFGIRLATRLLRDGDAKTASELAQALRRASGLEELRDLLNSVFLERAETLKARSTLAALESLVLRAPPDDGGALDRAVEQFVASTHAFAELRGIEALRSGGVRGKAEVLAEAERLLGAVGKDAGRRLGLPGDGDDDVDSAARAALVRWQKRAESPMTSHELAAVARVAVRSCEGILTSGAAP